MIKATTEIRTEKYVEYPKLMNFRTDKGFVVLFSSHVEGVVVSIGRTGWQVGNVMSKSDDTYWQDFTGQVTLENE